MFERTSVFSGIQFTKHFIGFVFVGRNQLIGINSNVILIRQTCEIDYRIPSSYNEAALRDKMIVEW